MQQHLLTILILLPVAGALVTGRVRLFAGTARRTLPLDRARVFHPDVSALTAVDQNGAGGLAEFRFVENVSWIGAIGARYHVGVDGISLWLVLLTTLLVPIAILSSWTAITKRQLSYYVFMLILEAAMIGVFVSLDLLLFYLFFEASLVPMFLLIGIWGGERRVYAAVKFFIYTAVGSLLMLVAIIALYFIYNTFDYTVISAAMRAKGGPLVVALRVGAVSRLCARLLYQGAVVSLSHLAAGRAHGSAHRRFSHSRRRAAQDGNVRVAALQSGALSGDGRKFAPVMITLAVIGIIYGALVAMVQPDVKRLVAYSSVSHMGFVVLGLFSFTELGMQGALYQMLNHGVSTGALFLFVGFVYERRHTRMISEFGGLATPMPWFSTLFVIASLSSIGLPFLNGFVGEFLIMIGTWTSTPFSHVWIVTMLAGTGVIWAAVYMLWMLQRVLFGKVTNPKNAQLSDLNAREIGLLIPLLVLMLFMGVYPQPFLDRSKAAWRRCQSGGTIASAKSRDAFAWLRRSTMFIADNKCWDSVGGTLCL